MLFAIAVLIAPLSSAQAADPAEILKKLASRRAEIKSLDHLTETVVRTANSSRRTKSHCLEERLDGQIRFRLLEESVTTGSDKKESTSSSLTVCDGTTQWQEKAAAGAAFVIKGQCVTPKPLSDVLALAKNAKTRIRTSDTIHGQPCQVVDIVGQRNGKTFKATFWITDQGGLVLRSAEVDSGGLKVEMNTLALKINGPIEKSPFAYEPPKNARVIDTGKMKSLREKNARP